MWLGVFFSSAVHWMEYVALAWLVYLYLRLLGERHLATPDLGEEIRRAHERRKDESDYTI